MTIEWVRHEVGGFPPARHGTFQTSWGYTATFTATCGDGYWAMVTRTFYVACGAGGPPFMEGLHEYVVCADLGDPAGSARSAEREYTAHDDVPLNDYGAQQLAHDADEPTDEEWSAFMPEAERRLEAAA